MITLDFTDMKIKRLTGDDKIDAFCSGDDEVDDCFIINTLLIKTKRTVSIDKSRTAQMYYDLLTIID